MNNNRYGGHGFDVNNDAFGNIAATLYMLLEAVRGVYRRQSDLCATACGPLWGKRVIDMGCGFGTTTVAIAQHNPKEVLAVDNSDLLTDIFQTLLMKKCDERNLDNLLTSLHTEKTVGGGGTKRLLQLLRKMCDEFANSTFRQKGGAVNLIRGSCIELSIGGFDAIVGNNFVHWPINKLRKQLEDRGMDSESAHHDAIISVLRSLGAMLEPGGRIALLEPKNFVVIDNDHKLDAMITKRSSVLTHPVYMEMDRLANELLARDYSIIREPAKPVPLFKTSEVHRLFTKAGFHSIQIHINESYEGTLSVQEVIETVFASIPMHLAGVNLPMKEKIKIAKRLRHIAKQTISSIDFNQPMQEVAFVFTAVH